VPLWGTLGHSGIFLLKDRKFTNAQKFLKAVLI
jgi:hypothetical protein